jgi:hypothetical protein
MKLFHFYRAEDQSGVSGTGAVVEGVEFTNGWCALRWLSQRSSMCFYQSLEDVKAVHGHGGRTEIIVHDFEPLQRRTTRTNDQRFELLMAIIEESARIASFAEDPDSDEKELFRSVAEIRRLTGELESSLGKPLPRSA